MTGDVPKAFPLKAQYLKSMREAREAAGGGHSDDEMSSAGESEKVKHVKKPQSKNPPKKKTESLTQRFPRRGALMKGLLGTITRFEWSSSKMSGPSYIVASVVLSHCGIPVPRKRHCLPPFRCKNSREENLLTSPALATLGPKRPYLDMYFRFGPGERCQPPSTWTFTGPWRLVSGSQLNFGEKQMDGSLARLLRCMCWKRFQGLQTAYLSSINSFIVTF